jgi:hypothetical protein
MPTSMYKESRTCKCGYSTQKITLWSRHQKCCKLIPNPKDALISMLEQQLATKGEQLVTKDEQMAAKDEQIRELIQVAKKPRTVNSTHNTTNRYVVEQHINVFGKESMEHIRPEQIDALLADPAKAVSRYIKLKYQKAPGGVNANVRVPNQKRAIYQVVVTNEDGEKEWEDRSKGEVLEKLYDDNSRQLEAEAMEQEHASFMEHQDLVRASAASDSEDGGRRYKEQLDKIHMAVGA